MGLTITRCQSCANNPIFAEVVQERYKTMVYAFDRAIELSFGALAAPAVGILAERVFGYDISSSGIIIPDSSSPAEARAFFCGMFWVNVIPSAIGSLLYTFFVFHICQGSR
ncbi:unnamed protein product [Sphagnum troendelagicum]|uniref:Uncharacterized protein n=1 Tax=Sphagnum troendelagicum TaxID=128251 RepID=A0ABP0UQ70_9BRYO